jgi:transposase-like protein
MNDNFPKNEVEFDRQFSSEKDCLEYLFQLRWPEGFKCPRCGHLECWHASRDRYLCRQCKHQQSLTAGTIFHGTKKSLRLWFKALWWFSTSKSSVNASTLKALLGLGSYQTAWCWLQKLRTCTVFPDRSPLSGSVEVDEFFLGGEHSGQRGRGANHKCKVAIAVERQGRKLGRLRLQVIPRCSAEELTAFARLSIVPGSQITTDGWTGYSGLQAAGFDHKVINQSKVADKESVLPGVHLVTSLFKRVMLGTFQGRFDPQYLQRYLDEYVFRFNRRTCKSVGKRFWRIAQQTVSSSPITWKQLRLSSAASGAM